MAVAWSQDLAGRAICDGIGAYALTGVNVEDEAKRGAAAGTSTVRVGVLADALTGFRVLGLRLRTIGRAALALTGPVVKDERRETPAAATWVTRGRRCATCARGIVGDDRVLGARWTCAPAGPCIEFLGGRTLDTSRTAIAAARVSVHHCTCHRVTRGGSVIGVRATDAITNGKAGVSIACPAAVGQIGDLGSGQVAALLALL